MNQKSRYAFRIVLGGWLAYIGCSLLYQMYSERPSNMIVISLIAVVFVIIGAICVIHSLTQVLHFWKGDKPEHTADEEDVDAEADINKMRRNSVQTVALKPAEAEEEKEEQNDSGQESALQEEKEQEQEQEQQQEPASESVPEQHAEVAASSEDSVDRDVEILEVVEEETDNHADEIENDYEEK